MNKAKMDVENLKNFSAHLIQRLGAPEPVNEPKEIETETEQKSEENQEE